MRTLVFLWHMVVIQGWIGQLPKPVPILWEKGKTTSHPSSNFRRTGHSPQPRSDNVFKYWGVLQPANPKKEVGVSESPRDLYYHYTQPYSSDFVRARLLERYPHDTPLQTRV
eukprot:Gregarina_sp_Poly_1__10346@NODE_735_length_6554_cov_122_722984_g550_i0_p7_GENE_NODE_735_length_6554_cov_122_722984_g550_i0NODE_735_length_6554_cov_122_722984_g550_i0_p7_ORF_typecomplete_len112_score0_67_NODE_735_length_6554_cov_122_722984_g550_i062397